MNFLSCNNCGVVIDTDQLVEPEIFDDDGAIIDENAMWDGRKEKYVPYFNCPVCSEKVKFN